MPIYEYSCDDCSHRFEALQKMNDEALTKCPKCGLNNLFKLISAAGFRLKGTGWYASDFKTPKPISTKTEAVNIDKEPN